MTPVLSELQKLSSLSLSSEDFLNQFQSLKATVHTCLNALQKPCTEAEFLVFTKEVSKLLYDTLLTQNSTLLDHLKGDALLSHKSTLSAIDQSSSSILNYLQREFSNIPAPTVIEHLPQPVFLLNDSRPTTFTLLLKEDTLPPSFESSKFNHSLSSFQINSPRETSSFIKDALNISKTSPTVSQLPCILSVVQALSKFNLSLSQTTLQSAFEFLPFSKGSMILPPSDSSTNSVYTLFILLTKTNASLELLSLQKDQIKVIPLQEGDAVLLDIGAYSSITTRANFSFLTLPIHPL